MLKKEAKKHQGARDTHGITSRGNSLYRIVAQSLGLVAASAVAVAAFLVVIRQPLVERELVALVTDGFAEQRAQAIAAQVASLSRRATRASRGAAVKEALVGDSCGHGPRDRTRPRGCVSGRKEPAIADPVRDGYG